MSTPLPSTTAPGGHHAIAAAALMATYMQAVNISIPNAALPHLQATLSMANDEVGWVFSSYIAASAVTMSITQWLAGRYGLEAPLMDLATGRRNRVAVAQLIRRTLKEIEPHARELGSDRELAGIEEILRNGNGADRQLRVFNANRDIVEVVSEIADTTEVAALPQLAT